MMKLVSKFAMDIFPSVLATIIGAYIVNHYINVRPPAAGTTAAAVAPAEPKKAARTDSKPAERSADLSNIPEAGVRAKGISEKAISDKSAAEKAAVEKAAEKEKASDKADKPSETASIPPVAPAETRRHQPSSREKATAKTAPAAAPAAEPVVAAPATAPAAAEPDANDLARAAIERLRGSNHSQEAARVPEPARVVTAPAVAPPPPPPSLAAAPSAQPSSGQPVSVQPLPPPILVSTPSADSKPAADPNRPTPPADIPDPRAPLDLRADAIDAPPAKRPSVADDVLAAAKNMFHSVLPK